MTQEIYEVLYEAASSANRRRVGDEVVRGCMLHLAKINGTTAMQILGMSDEEWNTAVDTTAVPHFVRAVLIGYTLTPDERALIEEFYAMVSL